MEVGRHVEALQHRLAVAVEPEGRDAGVVDVNGAEGGGPEAEGRADEGAQDALVRHDERHVGGVLRDVQPGGLGLRKDVGDGPAAADLEVRGVRPPRACTRGMPSKRGGECVFGDACMCVSMYVRVVIRNGTVLQRSSRRGGQHRGTSKQRKSRTTNPMERTHATAPTKPNPRKTYGVRTSDTDMQTATHTPPPTLCVCVYLWVHLCVLKR